MGMVQPVWGESEFASQRVERATPPPAREPRDDPGAAFDRRPVEMNGKELVPIAGVVLVVAGVLALLLLYLTTFGRLTAQGSYLQGLGSDIKTLRETNTGLAGDVAELSKTERIAQEARTLGLQPVAPAQTHALPAGAVELPADEGIRHAQVVLP